MRNKGKLVSAGCSLKELRDSYAQDGMELCHLLANADKTGSLDAVNEVVTMRLIGEIANKLETLDVAIAMLITESKNAD